MFRLILNRLGAISAILLVANEVRGAILAAPVFYGLWLSGGTLMALWLAFCSLAGIGLSVVVPMWVVRKLRQTAAPVRLQ